MATLTTADLDNGKRDLETVDAVANSPADTITTRYGDTVLTLAGALRRLGYAAPVPYASGLVIDSGLTTVSRDGAIYAPDPLILPFTTGAWDPAQWRVVQNTQSTNQVYQFPTLGAAQSAAATLPDGSAVVVDGVSQGHAVGGEYVADGGVPALSFESYAELQAYTGKASLFQVTGQGIAGLFSVLTGDNTSVSDGGTVFVLPGGRRVRRLYDGKVNVQWFGAVSGDTSAAAALANTKAFRTACLSMKSDWLAYSAKYGKGRGVYAPAGDYNLSNGFTIPKGCSLEGDGIGDTRLRVLPGTVDSDPKLPLVSLGRVINNTTLATEVTTGAYVQDPPPSIDNIYLNPQNSGTALDITDIPGFKVGDMWIQADVAINVGDGSGDGVFGKLFLEDSTGYGIKLGACQNLIFPSVYTFVCSNPVVISGNCNNINFGVVQSNYTKVAVVQTLDGVEAGRVSISSLVCNQNEQYLSFTDVINMRSNSCELRIASMDARNYTGFAVNNSSGLGNKVFIGSLVLRQQPNKPSYTVGNGARGIRVNNCEVSVGNADIQGLATSPFEFVGTFSQSLKVDSGVIGNFGGTGKVVNITGTNGWVQLQAINNASGVGLFNHQQFVAPAWSGVIRPFPLQVENGRRAVKIPFCGKASAFNVTISANPSPGSNPNYRRTRKLWVTQETGFVGSPVTSLYAASLGNSGLSSSFSPDLVHQLDINVVGGGFQAPLVDSGEIVISVPESYGDVNYSVSQEL
ncbi:hypothetical protein [Pseudomonas sp.]|uniref:hypothetical protein n=1 Tax=Pseudomonas sp. TaxID=306 RepID=UPI002586B74E|nr:hypothetical protein [Pseudomonas sp.]